MLEAYDSLGRREGGQHRQHIGKRNNNLPLVQFYEITSDGDEVHLAERDMNAELLSATLLFPSVIPQKAWR